MTQEPANVQAANRLKTIIDEGRLTRDHYREVKGGREYVCLLVAMAPICGEVPDEWDSFAQMMPNTKACPTDIMPLWMAYMTMCVDHGVSRSLWFDMVNWYASTAARWHVLDDAAWRRVEMATLRQCLNIAIDSKRDKQGLLPPVIELIDEEAHPEDPRWRALEDSYDIYTEDTLVYGVLYQTARVGRNDPLVQLSHVAETLATECAKAAAINVDEKIRKTDVQYFVRNLAYNAVWKEKEESVWNEICGALLTNINIEISKKENAK